MVLVHKRLEGGKFVWPQLRDGVMRMSDVNPVGYLAATLRAILDGHPQSGIEDLMPWRFNQPSSLAA